MIPDTVYEFRALWGDPANRGSSAPYAVRSRPEPQFQSIASTNGIVDILWSIRLNHPFEGMLHRFPNGDESGTIEVGEVAATAAGVMHAQDSTATPGQTFIYYLTWEVGGELLRDTGYSVEVTPVSVFPHVAGHAAILGLANPSLGIISFRVAIENDEPAEVALFDLAGRLCSRQVVTGPGQHPIRFDGSHLPAGIYLLRLSQAGHRAVTRVALVR